VKVLSLSVRLNRFGFLDKSYKKVTADTAAEAAMRKTISTNFQNEIKPRHDQ
jgi:hypothetical protein